MGYTTVPEALRAAGTKASDTVADLRSADCGQPVGDLAAALPGSSTAGAASRFSSWWTSGFRGWCGDADKHGQNLIAAARDYGTTEHATKDRFAHAPKGAS